MIRRFAVSTGLVSDERYFWIEMGHWIQLGQYSQPFPAMDSPDGKRRILNLLRASGIMKQLTEIEPHMATEDQLLRLHTQEYIDHVKLVSETSGGEVGEATAICAGGYDIARLAVGGCIAAFDAVLAGEVQNAFALVRPWGTMQRKTVGVALPYLGTLQWRSLMLSPASTLVELQLLIGTSIMVTARNRHFMTIPAC